MPKNNSFSLSFFLLVIIFLSAGFITKTYLKSQETVPAWIPPVLCPCWNSDGYFCESTGVCLSKNNPVIPTPTPVPAADPETFSQFSISSLTFSTDCKLTVTNSHRQYQNFPIYPPSVFPPDACPTHTIFKISPSGNLAAFIDFSTPSVFHLKIYFHRFRKVLTLMTNPIPLLDLEFTPDSRHLVSLSANNTLTVFDLASLAATYPANVNFRTDVFSSSALQTRTITLPPAPQEYTHLLASSPDILVTGLSYQTLAQFPEETLYPRSSCSCWNTRLSSCLPQSSCLNR